MFERISLKLVELFAALKREEGQGATEYAMVIGFLVVTLARRPRCPRRRDQRRSSTGVADARSTRTGSVGQDARDGSDEIDCVRLADSSLSDRLRRSAAGAPGAFIRRRSELPRAAAATQREGQAAVEFALVVPVLCLVVLALIDFGKALNYWLDTSHLAGEGSRLAAVLGNSPEPGGDWKAWIAAAGRVEGAARRDGRPRRRRLRLPAERNAGEDRRPGPGQVSADYMDPVRRRRHHQARGPLDDAARAASDVRSGRMLNLRGITEPSLVRGRRRAGSHSDPHAGAALPAAARHRRRQLVRAQAAPADAGRCRSTCRRRALR